MTMNNRRSQAAKSLGAFFGGGPASDLSPSLKSAIAKFNLAAMKPGAYLYTDPIGGDPQKITVRRDGDQLLARFDGLAGDEGAEIPVQDMAGNFEPL